MALYENERVSVIIPVFKVERFIEQTILSVVNQNYPDIEIVLVDDCSPDRTAAIIKNMQEKYTNIEYYKLDKNSGAAVARNKALDIATGRYVAFLDGDDMWAEGKLEKQMAYMKKHNAAISCTAMDTVDEKGQALGSVRNVREKITYKFLLHNTMIATSTTIIDRNQTGDFQMPLRRGGQDYATWLMLMRNGIVCCGLDEVLSHYRVVSNSLSSNKWKSIRQVWEIQTVNEGINKVSAAINVCFFVVNGFIKHFIK